MRHVVLKLCLALCVFGVAAQASGLEKSGFYLGGTLGVNSPTVKSTVSDNTGLGTFSTDISKAGLMFGLHAGWRVYVKEGFHGVEASYRDSTAKGTYNMGSLGGGFKTNASFDLSYKGGYAFASQTYVTGRLGYGWLRGSHQVSGSWYIQNGSFNHTLGYILAGLGVEHHLSNSLSLSGEYLYRHATEDVKKRHMYTDQVTYPGEFTDIKGKYTDHSFVLAINYFF